MGELQMLHNIGKALELQLEAAGVCSYDDLVRLGSRKAWLRIQAADPSACLNRLMALEGAIQRVRWHALPEGEKAELRAFYRGHK